MVKEYRVGTDCGTPSILCNGVPIGLDEVVAILNSTYTEQQNAITVSDRYPVYFVNAECEGAQYNCIILCTKSDVFDRIVEQFVFKDIKQAHGISGTLFLSTCSLLGHTTIDDAKKRGLTIV